MHSKTILLGFTLCASVLAAPLSGSQSEGTVAREAVSVMNHSSEVDQREVAAKDGEMHTNGLGIWKRKSEVSSSRQGPHQSPTVSITGLRLTCPMQASAVNSKRTGFGIISGGSNEEA